MSYLRFIISLRSSFGLEVKQIVGDGNCFYRTLAYCIHEDEHRYRDIKDKMMEYIYKHESHLRNVLGHDLLDRIKTNVATNGHFTDEPAIMDISCLTFNISLRVFKCNMKSGEVEVTFWPNNNPR